MGEAGFVCDVFAKKALKFFYNKDSIVKIKNVTSFQSEKRSMNSATLGVANIPRLPGPAELQDNP